MASTIETFILDRSGLLREGLSQLLKDTRYNPVYCGASSPPDGFTTGSSRSPSLVILGPDFVGAAPIFLEPRHSGRPYRVVVLLHTCSDQQTVEEFRASADAFLLSTVSISLLVKSLDLVMEGVSVMPSELVETINPKLRLAEAKGLPITAAMEPLPEASQASSLSEREMLVLRRLMEGASNKMIARDLGIAEATVKVHVKAIFRKACLRNRTQVALWATRQELSGGRIWPNRPELAYPEDAPIEAKPKFNRLISLSELETAASRAA